jgi:hypothetical protein
MDPNPLYSALKTIAQCSAALAVLISFLGVGRLDRRRAEREQALQLLYRRPFNRLGADQEIARHGEEFFVQNAEAYVRELEQALGADGPAGLKLKQATARWRAIPGEQRQCMDVLQRFLRRTLVSLALAISGLVVVDALYSWMLTRWLTGLLIIFAAYRLGRDPYAVVQEAVRSTRVLLILVLLLLASPALAGSGRCTTDEEKTLGHRQTLCHEGTRVVSTWSSTRQQWQSTITASPRQECRGVLNPRTHQVEGHCR